MSTKKPSATEVTPDLIEQWKKQFSKVVKYSTEDGKVAYFKNPDLTTIDAAASMVQSNPIKSNILIARNCFLGGDEEIITEEKYIFGLGNHLRELVVKVEGELSEL